MEYHKPELRALGSLAELTLGMGGSCLDGGARNNTQRGGGLEASCGSSGDNNNGGSFPF